MTVKIAKFFGASNNAGGPSVAGTPPPLPPPNSTMSNSKKYLRQQQKQQQQQLCHRYLDDIEDDNMSLYSTSASIMTTRDHPFNNSQRPLLGDKKPQAQILTTHQKKKKQQQQQQQQHQTAAVTYHFEQQQQQQPYISPFVQQQKRDSAKGLHGFNDFDILSQQYNQHLQSPHIGYPYGSPPSPTATSNDFIFSDGQSGAMLNNSAIQQQQQPQQPHHNQQQTSTPRYGNVPAYAPPSSWTLVCDQLNELDSLHSSANVTTATALNVGKSSRFEDDFCCRRNIEFSKHVTTAAVAASSSSCSSSSVSSGPFIFGVPLEQQRDGLTLMSRLPAMGGRGFVGECQLEPALSSDSGVSIAGDSGKFAVHTNGHSILQSTSDTSSSSRDSNKKGAKLLLRKNKSKSKKKTTPTTTKSPLDDEQQPYNEKTLVTSTTKQQTIKCVVVGDGAVGKTNLILSYLENRFIPEHVPTASDIYNADVMVNDSPVHLTLCDTAGQDTLDPLRELSYPDSDVFLLCFSVAKPETFHAIKTKWAPKFAKTRAALILVGTQADMRTNANVLNKLQTTGEKPISYADAWDLATTIGAKYIETSSATQDKVKEVFDTAIWEALRPNALPPTPPLWKKLLCMA